VTDHISFKTKLSYGLGALGKDFGCAPIYIFLMFYFTDIAGLEAAFVGTMFLFARFIDAVTDPMMGMVVDNTKSRFGKFRPWIVIGTLVNAAVVLALFKAHLFEGTSLYVYATIAYIVWGVTYTIMDIPFWSIIPALSKSRPEREKLVVWPRIFASMAWWLVGAYGLVTVSYFGNGDQAEGFFNASLAICVVFIASAFLVFFNVKEKVNTQIHTKFTPKDVVSIIRNNDQLRILIGCVLAFQVANMMIGGFALYYFKYVVGTEGLFSEFMWAAGLSEIAGVFLLPHLANRLPRKWMWLLACTLPVVSCAVLYAAGIISPQTAIFVGVAGGIVKFGVGMFNVLSTVMLADVVDYGEHKTGMRSESIIFSVQTMLVKLAGALSAFMTGVGLSLIGYEANVEQSESTITGIQFLMLGLPCILMFVSAFIYKRYYKLHEGFDRRAFEPAVEKEIHG